MGKIRQLGLFASAAGPALPSGFLYEPDIITPEEETGLVARIADLPFEAFDFRGYRGHRRIVSFGWDYEFGAEKLHPAARISDFLLPVRAKAARLAGLAATALEHVLVTEYRPGAPIGWHRDKAVFGDVVGISLASPCLFRFRRKAGSGWQRATIELEPRSAYVLRGPARTDWEHSIPPAESLRYSITFRSLR